MTARSQLAYLKTPVAIRERTEAVYRYVESGQSAHFTLNLAPLADIARQVIDLSQASYGGFSKVPFHSRWRHLEVDGGERAARLAEALEGSSTEECLRTEFDLVIASVLLDAGAGASYRYKTSDGRVWSRSEALALASFDAFLAGSFSSISASPCATHAARLAQFCGADVEGAFQVSDTNPLLGCEGRAALLQRLGQVAASGSPYFGGPEARPGNLGVWLMREENNGQVPAAKVLGAVLHALGPIWPSRLTLDGESLGDVWRHSAVGLVPFHKLSQWLSYSLCETLERAGVQVTGVDQLTGLAEYRNGGLFLDAGVLVPRDAELLAEAHSVDSEVVVEWRALTLVLLDRVAELVRQQLNLSVEALPLVRILEGGTWGLGRKYAFERRVDGSSPLQVISDGTVF